MQRLLAEAGNVTIIAGEAADLDMHRDKVAGIRLADGSAVAATAVIAATGHF